jgi:hypothetical protein
MWIWTAVINRPTIRTTMNVRVQLEYIPCLLICNRLTDEAGAIAIAPIDMSMADIRTQEVLRKYDINTRIYIRVPRILWEVIVSAILSKKMYMYMCPIPNGFRDRTISLYTVQTSNTPCPHTSWRWNFRKYIILGKLYQLWHLNDKYRYQQQYVISLSYQQFWNSTEK